MSLDADQRDLTTRTRNLVALVQRLARRLLKCGIKCDHCVQNHETARQALGFIERKGLRGSILRGDDEP